MWESYDDGFKILKLASNKKETSNKESKVEKRSQAKKEEAPTPVSAPKKLQKVRYFCSITLC